MCKITTCDIKAKSLDQLKDFLIQRLEEKIGKSVDRVPSESKYGEVPRPKTVVPQDGFYQIILTQSTKEYPPQRFFQMSHEVVHLMKPAIIDSYKNTSYLEEGFASFNSVYECNSFIPEYKAERFISEKYKKPLKILRKLGEDIEVFNFVKRILSNDYTLSNVPQDFINKNYKNIWTKEEVDLLLSKFYEK